MKRPIPPITQRLEELQRVLKSEKDVRRRQRLEMLYLLQAGHATTRQQVAALLGIHRQTVGAWLAAYEHGGLPALLTIGTPPGKVPRLSALAWAALQARLAQPEGFASYGQIRAYLVQEPGGSLAYSTVHALVRYKLQAKPKTPRPSHKKKTLRASSALLRPLPNRSPRSTPASERPSRGV